MHLPGTESRGRTWLHRASPALKLASALLIVSATVLLRRRLDAFYLAPAVLLAALWLWSRMPLRFALRRLLMAQLFILGIAFLSLLSPGGPLVFLSTLAKSNLCILTMLLLTYTTPFQEILQALRHWRLPPAMLTTLALMYRYLPVLAEEAKRMERARASRSFSRRRRLVWQNLGVILGQLFVRTAARAGRIYLAMCARGWK